jgi:hypothetical protein
MPASPLVLVSDNGGPFNSPSPPDNYGLDINPGDPVSLILQSPGGVSSWYLQIGLVQIIGGVPVVLPGTGADEITAPTPPSLSGVNPSTGLVSSPTATVTLTFPPAGSALLFSSTITGTFGVVTTTFVLFARTIEGFRVGPAGMTREGSGAAGWAAIVNPAIRAINTIWGVEVEHLVDGFLYYNGATLTWNVLGGDLAPNSTGGGTQSVEVVGIRNEAVPTLTSGYLHWNGTAFVWSNPPGSQPTGTGLWYSTSSVQNSTAITLSGDVSPAGLSGNNLPITVTGIRDISVPTPAPGFLYFDGVNFDWDMPPDTEVTGTGLWYSTSSTLNSSAITLGGDLTQGALSGGTLPVVVSGIKDKAVPSLTSGYLHYTGSAWVFDTPSSGGAAVTKTVDCTGAGTTIAATITAFDGTYVTVTGLGAQGAQLKGYYVDITQPSYYGPALGGGTFSGSSASVASFDGVHTATITGLNGMSTSAVGSNITFSGANTSGNNGSFPITAYISPTSVQVDNAAGFAPDVNNGVISWTTTVGTTANITAFATPLATITGLSGMYSGIVGKSIQFTGFANGANNSTFQIAAYISPTSVTITNASAVSPDAGGIWFVNPGSLDGTNFEMTVDSVPLGTIAGYANYEGLWEIQTAAPTSLITGDTVTISSNVSYINGNWTVTVLDSTHFVLQGNVYHYPVGYDSLYGTVFSGPLTLTFDGATNAISEAAMLAAFTTVWPTVVATQGGYGGDGITLTGTTLGTSGSITVVVGGSSESYLAIYGSAVGTAGVDVGGQLPTALSLSNFFNDGNNGTFNVHSWIDSSTVTVLNTAGVSPDGGMPAIISVTGSITVGTLYGPAISGAAATITSFATPLATVGGLTGMTPAIVGQSITFTGFTNGANNSTFVVQGYISSTSVTIYNPSAVSPDSGGAWSVPVGSLNGTTLIMTVDGVGPTTLTLNTTTNAASQPALFAAIEATWPHLTLSINNQDAIKLTENSTFGGSSTILIGAGTANSLLGFSNGQNDTGTLGFGDFAVSLFAGSPPISGSAILSLTGLPVTYFKLSTQECGDFRVQVENSTFTTATFAAPNNLEIGSTTAQSVSFDGTTVNYDAPVPATPPAYVIGSFPGAFSGSSVSVSPSPNTPFVSDLSGTSTAPIGTVDVGDGSPFYGLFFNQSTQPVTVANSGATAFSGQLIGVGQAALVLSDGTGIWSFSSITADNGRADRYRTYLTRQAATGSNMTNPIQTGNNGGDLIWGTYIDGGPYNQGVPSPFMDGSFNTTLADNAVGSDPVTPLAGQDIGVLGNIVYMAGYISGSPTLCAFSIGTGVMFAQVTLSSLPNTLIAFKEVADVTGSIGGPSDCVLVVNGGDVTTYGLNTIGGFNFNHTYTGTWPGARGILILGDNSNASTGGTIFYSSIGVWTDPSNGNIWAADVINAEIGLTQVYSGGNFPSAICLDRETENFWVAFQITEQISLFNISLELGENLLTTLVSSFPYPGGASGIDDILFDGAYLWAISVVNNTYYQMTPNGFVVSSYGLSSDAVTLTSDSRLYSDGSSVYITSLFKNPNSAVVRINPGTGLPAEYFTFPVFSTRGLAFYNDELFVSTAPTINLSSSPYTNTGFFGTIATAVAGFSTFTDTTTPGNWDPSLAGNYIYISGAAEPVNNGFFQVIAWTSATSITIANPSGDGSGAETHNGNLQWQMYGATCGIQRMVSEPPGTDFGILDSIIQTPAVQGWSKGMRLGARVVEYTNYGGSPHTFEIDVRPLPGTRVLFVDRDGLSGNYPLTIFTPSDTINGQSNCTLQGPYAFLEIEWDGNFWLIVRQSNLVTSSGGPRPPYPTLGQICFDANISLPIWWNGSQWINAAGTPV